MTRREDVLAHQMGPRLGLSPNDPTLAIEALSGGNQQKVVVGRWLGANRRLLITEDPTASVDVGAKAEIYRLRFAALAAAGIAGDGAPKAVAAGDGPEGACQRIRSGQYQAVTVAEPLNQQGCRSSTS